MHTHTLKLYIKCYASFQKKLRSGWSAIMKCRCKSPDGFSKVRKKLDVLHQIQRIRPSSPLTSDENWIFRYLDVVTFLVLQKKKNEDLNHILFISKNHHYCAIKKIPKSLSAFTLTVIRIFQHETLKCIMQFR